MLGGSMEVWTKNILYRFIEDQTRFGMPRGAKMSLALNETYYVGLHSKSNATSEHALLVESNHWYSMQNNHLKIIVDQLPTKSPIELELNSIVLLALGLTGFSCKAFY